ncbi:hypothetical protein C6Y08_07815, partial [Lactiplantibacillus pentosus]
AISNTSLLLAREDHPDKKNFALEHCQPAPSVGKPLEWRMNGHRIRCNWPLNIKWLVLQANFESVSKMSCRIRRLRFLLEYYSFISSRCAFGTFFISGD